MAELFEKKNHDYGDSFEKIFNDYGLLSSVIRIRDKIGRIETLMEKEAKVIDESIEDSLLDLATYSIMTLIELKKE